MACCCQCASSACRERDGGGGEREGGREGGKKGGAGGKGGGREREMHTSRTLIASFDLSCSTTELNLAMRPRQNFNSLSGPKSPESCGASYANTITHTHLT